MAQPAAAAGSVVVIGTGLIGTSVALALREHDITVWLADHDGEAVRLAANIGAGLPLPADGVPGGPADVAVLAVPPVGGRTRAPRGSGPRPGPRLYRRRQRQGATAGRSHASWAVTSPAMCLATRCLAASDRVRRPRRADLFVGRPWVLCPQPANDEKTIFLVTGLAQACGALPLAVSAAEHDQWVALVSHAPHVVAAAMAARLEAAPEGALALAGQGLRDVTRIAASGAGMWLQILAANAGPASAVLRDVAADLAQAADALESLAAGDEQAIKQVADLLERGIDGVHRIPGKHGGPTGSSPRCRW